MYRTMLKAKIHRAVVTDADLDYEGSITIDRGLLEQAGMAEFELVQVVDLNNGARFETYLIAGEKGSGEIQLNGAAARLALPGDLVIIMSYCQVPEEQVPGWKPTILLLDGENQVKEALC